MSATETEGRWQGVDERRVEFLKLYADDYLGLLNDVLDKIAELTGEGYGYMTMEDVLKARRT